MTWWVSLLFNCFIGGKSVHIMTVKFLSLLLDGGGWKNIYIAKWIYMCLTRDL